METMSRRSFVALLGAMGVAGAAGLLVACGDDNADDPDEQGAGAALTVEPSWFPDGVIAGDPRPAGAAVWTRIDEVALGAGVAALRVEVARAADFASLEYTSEAIELTEAGGRTVAVDQLDSDAWWYYRFVALDADGSALGASRTGRLRTAPKPGTALDKPLRFAFASCQQLSGEYAAQAQLAKRDDVDFLIHLGDYVYVNDQETLTVDDYLEVYRRFKAQPPLQDLQAQIPLVAMWDDGEFYNGVDGKGDPQRLANARAAWFENMPVLRDPDAPSNDADRIYRTLTWGALADLFMIDVRQYRDPAIEAYDTNDPAAREIFNPTRTTLGAEQKAWLKEQMSGSAQRGTPWRFFGNPYDLAMWRLVDTDQTWPRPEGALTNSGVYAPNEAWDDYWAERRELLQFIADEDITNVISCSGHTHIWIASDLRPDPDDPSSPVVGFDFTCGSQTADPDLLADVTGDERAGKVAGFRQSEEASLKVNPWMTYGNLVDQGFAIVEVSESSTAVEFWFVDPFDPTAEAKLGARFTVVSGATSMDVERFDDARRV